MREVSPYSLRPGDVVDIQGLGREHVIEGPFRSTRGVRFVDQYGNSVLLRPNEGVNLVSHVNPTTRTLRHNPVSRHGLPGCQIARHNPTASSLVPWGLALAATFAAVQWYRGRNASTAAVPHQSRPFPTSIGALPAAQQSQYVTIAQRQLAAMHFYSGPINGVMDDATRNALVAFVRADASRLDPVRNAAPEEATKAMDLLDRATA